MLNCKQASQLASRSMDEELPFWKNCMLKMHLLLCRSCTNFARQLDFLRKAASRPEAYLELQLTSEARRRIAAALNDKQNGN